MPIELSRSYINKIRLRYQNSTKKEKTLILNEFCQVCDYTRKYAIRVLTGKVQPRLKKPGPKSKYDDPKFIFHLVELWQLMGEINSKKMKSAIPHWLPFYKALTPHHKALMLEISSASIDRHLKPHKSPQRLGMSSTKPSALKNKIPLKLLEEHVNYPGFIEADTVAHCGESLSGNFVSTLKMTDLCTGWTENRALFTKTSEQVVKQVKRIESRLPFDIVGVAVDNGSEFLNYELHKYLTDRKAPLSFVRRRPYKKNENAHVEQKNFTHVRQLLGYERIDDEKAVGMINEICQVYFNPLQNFFIPSQKLIKKERVGSKIKKTFDTPKTPYERLLESPYVSKTQKNKLKEMYKQKNPIFLSKELNKKLKELREYLDTLSKPALQRAGSDS
jgi:hypothetical protein